MTENKEKTMPDLGFEPGTCVREGDGLMKEDEDALISSLKESMEKSDRKKHHRTVKTDHSMPRWAKTLIWVFCIFAIAGTIGYFGLTFALDFLGLASGDTVDVNVEKGATAAQIADTLEENGIIRSSFMFRVFLKVSKKGADFKYGVYTMSPDLGYLGISDKLSTEGMKAESVRVTVPEGATVDEIADLLDVNGICTKEDFFKVVKKGEFKYDFIEDIPQTVHYRLEGYLYPDTYEFFNYGGEDCAYRAVDKMLANFNDHVDAAMRAEMKQRGFTLHEITTMASIVEMEAGGAGDADRLRVAAVFFNRLAWTDEPNFLGSTPTAHYPYGDGRYDTNKTQGLPPGPLCSPSLKSLQAATEPMENFDYNYFVTDADMKFYYNKTYAEHNATIARLKQQGMWK